MLKLKISLIFHDTESSVTNRNGKNLAYFQNIIPNFDSLLFINTSVVLHLFLVSDLKYFLHRIYSPINSKLNEFLKLWIKAKILKT